MFNRLVSKKKKNQKVAVPKDKQPNSKGEKKRTEKAVAPEGKRLANEQIDGPQDEIDMFANPPPKFKDTAQQDHEELLIKKLQLCKTSFSWPESNDPGESNRKQIKREHLLELVEYIGPGKRMSFGEAVLREVVAMVSANLFRSLPTRANRGLEMEADEDSFPHEPSWPHLQIVYEFFLRFIISGHIEARGLQKFINSSFVLNVLELFDSEDRRERDYLKTILHRLYAKFMARRAFIRKAINHTFWTLVDANVRHNGIAELLEILGSIINGFALPLKTEHKHFLFKVLIPMHKISSVALFHTQLSYCVTQFVDKEDELAVSVLTGLLRLWPRTDSSKEMLFLHELEELLELTPATSFPAIVPLLCEKLCQSVGSSHFQIAERALFLWQNEYIYGLCSEYRDKVLPRLYKVLFENSHSHWNPMVQKLTTNVLGVFKALDGSLVDKCHQEYEAKEAVRQEREIMREQFFQQLETTLPPASAPASAPAPEAIPSESDEEGDGVDG